VDRRRHLGSRRLRLGNGSRTIVAPVAACGADGLDSHRDTGADRSANRHRDTHDRADPDTDGSADADPMRHPAARWRRR
jgi:hypothetical protein